MSVNQNTTLLTVLQAADKLSTLFHQQHSSSLSFVESISSAFTQLSNLAGMPDSNRAEGGIKERGMIKLQDSIEASLSGLRDSLQKMENTVEQLGSLLYDAELYLSTPGTALAHGLNPKEALTHVSGLQAAYYAELIRLRELLSDFTCEDIDAHTLLEEWRTMKEVDKNKEQELDELVDVLGSWST